MDNLDKRIKDRFSIDRKPDVEGDERFRSFTTPTIDIEAEIKALRVALRSAKRRLTPLCASVDVDIAVDFINYADSVAEKLLMNQNEIEK